MKGRGGARRSGATRMRRRLRGDETIFHLPQLSTALFLFRSRDASTSSPHTSPRVAMSDEVRASHLLVKHQGSRRPASWRDPDGQFIPKRTKDAALEELLAYKEQIDSGVVAFADLAAKVSDCSSAKHGGDLGSFGRGKMQKAFEVRGRRGRRRRRDDGAGAPPSPRFIPRARPFESAVSRGALRLPSRRLAHPTPPPSSFAGRRVRPGSRPDVRRRRLGQRAPHHRSHRVRGEETERAEVDDRDRTVDLDSQAGRRRNRRVVRHSGVLAATYRISSSSDG